MYYLILLSTAVRPLHSFLHHPVKLVVGWVEALWADVAYLHALRMRLDLLPMRRRRPAEHEHDQVAAICTSGPESAAFDDKIVHLAVHNVVGPFVVLFYQVTDAKIHF